MLDNLFNMMERTIQPDLNQRIAARVRTLRAERGLSLEALATRSDVSRSMISLIERGESSPTAVLLERVAAGLGVMLADLFVPAQAPAHPLARRTEQAEWRDPASSYLRRNLSPPGFVSPIQLVEVVFPAGARVAYDSVVRERAVHQQVWLIDGRIDITLGAQRHSLKAGDCLAMQLDQPVVYHNPTRQAARYLVAIVNAGRSSS